MRPVVLLKASAHLAASYIRIDLTKPIEIILNGTTRTVAHERKFVQDFRESIKSVDAATV